MTFPRPGSGGGQVLQSRIFSRHGAKSDRLAFHMDNTSLHSEAASFACSQLLFDMSHQGFVNFRVSWHRLFLPTVPILIDIVPDAMPQ